MKMKRFLVVSLVFALCLFTATSSGNNELGYLQMGSQSDDPFVSMKTLSYIGLYTEAFRDRIDLHYSEVEDTLILQFSDEIDAYFAMEPEI